MKCTECGFEVSPNSTECSYCGAELHHGKNKSNRKGSTFRVLKFALWNTLTFGLYAGYWSWKKWTLLLKLQGVKQTAIIRGLFFSFTAFWLFNDFQELATSRFHYKKTLRAGLTGTAVFCITAFILWLDDYSPWSLTAIIIMLATVSVIEGIILEPLNLAVSYFSNHDEDAKKAEKSIKRGYLMILILVVIGVAAITIETIDYNNKTNNKAGLQTYASADANWSASMPTGVKETNNPNQTTTDGTSYDERYYTVDQNNESYSVVSYDYSVAPGNIDGPTAVKNAIDADESGSSTAKELWRQSATISGFQGQSFEFTALSNGQTYYNEGDAVMVGSTLYVFEYSSYNQPGTNANEFLNSIQIHQ